MANTKSAIKRIRRIARQTVVNRSRKSKFKKAIKKKDATPFKVPDNIIMMVVDLVTGEKADFTSKKTIIEAFKEKNINGENISGLNDIKNRFKKHNILRFY